MALLMPIFGLLLRGKTIVNDVPDYRQAPAKTPLSEKLAKDLKKRGFKFTGPVAILSFLTSSRAS